MMKLLGVLLGAILLAGCATPARTDFTVRNHLPTPVLLKASASGFQKTIYLAPNGEFVGWVPTARVGEIQIELEVAP